MPAPSLALYPGTALVSRDWLPLQRSRPNSPRAASTVPAARPQRSPQAVRCRGPWPFRHESTGGRHGRGAWSCFFDSMGTVRNTPTRRAIHASTTLACTLQNQTWPRSSAASARPLGRGWPGARSCCTAAFSCAALAFACAGRARRP